MGNGTTSDDSNPEIVEIIEGFNITFEQPEAGGEDTKVAAWVLSPQMMFDYLADELRRVFENCQLVAFKGGNTMQIVVRPEFRNDSPDRMSEAAHLSFSWHFDANTIDLVNLTRQTPVNGQSLRNLAREICNGNTPKQGQAFTVWSNELRRLGIWVHALRSIDPKLYPPLPRPEGTTEERKRSATIEDVRAAFDSLVKQKVKVTKDALGKRLRELGYSKGSGPLNVMKNQIEKQSAVRPPDSAD